MSNEDVAVNVGQRVATARKLAGWTQVQLALHARYSVSAVRAVEQGREPATPAFIAAVARALGLEPEQLTGQPYSDDEGGSLEGVAELRAVIAEGPSIRILAPEDGADLAGELRELERHYREDRGKIALARLPVLLRQLYGTLDDTTSQAEKSRLFSTIAAAWVLAERLCRRFGLLTLAIPTLDRLDTVAEHADDPLYRSQAAAKRARVLMSYDVYDTPRVETALNQIVGTGTASTAVQGYVHLCGAIVAARGRDRDTALEHLGEADHLASQVHSERDEYGTLFGPQNVAIHRTAVELECGDPGRAAQLGDNTHLTDEVAPPRQGHHWQDTARAWLLAGQPNHALRALNRARVAAPQQTRHHPQVRETVRLIAEAERRRSDSLAGFAQFLTSGR